jgi:L-threonylcarbamoyladenylate synthase
MENQVTNFIEKISQGEVCLHPAGTLYGLTCDPLNPSSIQRVFAIKNRLADKSFLYLAANLNVAYKIWEPLPEVWNKALKSVWPNHLTVIWNLKNKFSSKLVHTDMTVGIRVPQYGEDKWFESVLEEFDFPLPTTSLNYSGEPSLIEPEAIEKFCLENNVYTGQQHIVRSHLEQKPSTIIKIENESSYTVVRKGAFQPSVLESFGLSVKK